MTETQQKYTGNNHIIGSGFHMSVGNPSFRLRLGDKEWLCEWHYYFGPSVLGKRTSNPLTRQPGVRSPFWIIVQWWKDQGAKVVDGVGVWEDEDTYEWYA